LIHKKKKKCKTAKEKENLDEKKTNPIESVNEQKSFEFGESFISFQKGIEKNTDVNNIPSVSNVEINSKEKGISFR
jgi:hypothetical protein